MLVAVAGCGRGPPAPTASTPPPVIADAAPELAGGPPPSDAPAASDAPPAGAAAESQIEGAAPGAPSAQAVNLVVTPPDLATAEPSKAGSEEIPDPLQPFNRRLFHVDQKVRQTVLTRTSSLPSPPHPPERVRRGLGEALRNLDEPTTAANELLQHRPSAALRTAARFIINSTVGIAGLFDVADRLGLHRTKANFSQTLASYGVGPGAYLYVPIRGPTSVRDVVGAMADSYFFPLRFAHLAALTQQAVLTVAKLEALPRSDQGFRYAAAPQAGPHGDAYLAVRRSYALNEQAQVHRQAPIIVPPLAGGPRAPSRRERQDHQVQLQLVSSVGPGQGEGR